MLALKNTIDTFFSLVGATRKVNYVVLMAIATLFLLLSISQQSFAQLPDFKALVKDSAPAVVNIATVKKKKQSG